MLLACLSTASSRALPAFSCGAGRSQRLGCLLLGLESSELTRSVSGQVCSVFLKGAFRFESSVAPLLCLSQRARSSLAKQLASYVFQLLVACLLACRPAAPPESSAASSAEAEAAKGWMACCLGWKASKQSNLLGKRVSPLAPCVFLKGTCLKIESSLGCSFSSLEPARSSLAK